MVNVPESSHSVPSSPKFLRRRKHVVATRSGVLQLSLNQPIAGQFISLHFAVEDCNDVRRKAHDVAGDCPSLR